MTGPQPRERAEAALGHVRDAAREMIAAAREALDLLDDVVSTADLGEVWAGLNRVGRSVFSWPPPGGPPPATTPSGPADAGSTPVAGSSPVEHITVH